MTTNDEWPLVLPNDAGLRSIGVQGQCFYCDQPIGQPHGKTCVCVLAHVQYVVTAKLPCPECHGDGVARTPDGEDHCRTCPGTGTVTRLGTFTTHDPWAWFESEGEYAGHWHFARNDGTWCADNADVEWADADTEELLDAARIAKGGDDGCTCPFLEFELSGVLDDKYYTGEPRNVDAPAFTEKEVRP